MASKDRGIEPFRKIQTLLLTMAGNCRSSPMRIAWWRPESCKGMVDSHSLSWAASSITKQRRGDILIVCSLAELDTVQKSRHAFDMQNFSIAYLSANSGTWNFRESKRRVLRHSLFSFLNFIWLWSFLCSSSFSSQYRKSALNLLW